MSDVLIAGGGVVGLSIAWELAGAGLKVCVLDQSKIGQEASWAGAGMIPPGDLNHHATHQLAALSAQLWPTLSSVLKSETGLDNGYALCGGLLLADSRPVEEISRAWKQLHVQAEIIHGAQLRFREPGLSVSVDAGVWMPEMAQVRNPWHVKALQAACRMRGVELHPGERVLGWDVEKNRLRQAITESGRFSAAEFIIACGAWTAQLSALLGVRLPIEPVHGQMVLLQGDAPVFNRVIEQGGHYLVPRNDGRVLVGATEERLGFQKRNTPEVIARLREFAAGVVPALSEFPIEKTWSGLRPWSGLGHPSIGRVTDYQNLLLAAGHFRAGISNSPGTALLLRELIFDEPPTIDVADFDSADSA